MLSSDMYFLQNENEIKIKSNF